MKSHRLALIRILIGAIIISASFYLYYAKAKTRYYSDQNSDLSQQIPLIEDKLIRYLKSKMLLVPADDFHQSDKYHWLTTNPIEFYNDDVANYLLIIKDYRSISTKGRYYLFWETPNVQYNNLVSVTVFEYSNDIAANNEYLLIKKDIDSNTDADKVENANDTICRVHDKYIFKIGFRNVSEADYINLKNSIMAIFDARSDL